MGNTQVTDQSTPVETPVQQKFNDKPHRIQDAVQKHTIHNKMRNADRYYRNGSFRGNGIRSS